MSFINDTGLIESHTLLLGIISAAALSLEQLNNNKAKITIRSKLYFIFLNLLLLKTNEKYY